MDHLLLSYILFILISLSSFSGVEPITFKFINKCRHTIWPGFAIWRRDSTAPLQQGFTSVAVNQEQLRFRYLGRVGSGVGPCAPDDSTGKFSCVTGDCGSGKVECLGSGAQPPATLAEFTLNGADGLDFYDVSLVDGYNLPMLVIPKKVTRGGCGATGCLIDLNGACPKELKLSAAAGGGKGCGGVQKRFYAYDDKTSTYNCAGTDYDIIFCPLPYTR
ncbi:hypothetical protein OIU78_008743 [Salix suchowensis]|nr:hypothetical protein OIU78_008743 [Salix suchowensis]